MLLHANFLALVGEATEREAPVALSNARKYQTESGDPVPYRFAKPIRRGSKSATSPLEIDARGLLEPALEAAVKGSPRCARPVDGARMKPLAA
jgi:hypothetical protein